MRIIAVGGRGAGPKLEAEPNEGVPQEPQEGAVHQAATPEEAPSEPETSSDSDLEDAWFAPDPPPTFDEESEPDVQITVEAGSFDIPEHAVDSVEELTEDDLAPVPSMPPRAAASTSEPSLEFHEELPGAVASAEAASPSAGALVDAPPPPPRRAAPPLNTPSAAPKREPGRKAVRHPWWEDLFDEDFHRANLRLTDSQIQREVAFIERGLGVAAGGIVLDLGCGGGHHAVEFARRGYGVVGYDLSLYQLALAADVAQENNQKINFLHGDMREMAFEEMFDGVFCWNTTFGYFEEEKNVAVAQRVFRALRPGGMFLVDVANRDFVAAHTPIQQWFEGDSCVCMDDASLDFITSRLRVKRSIVLDDGRTKECHYSLRLYALHELGKLLHDVGFRVTQASGDIGTPGIFFGPNSPRIIMVAQRP